MDSLIANIYRGKLIESSHKAIFLIKDYNNKTLISSGHEKKVIYPRSAIKIFQALPFMLSDADNKFSLTKQQIAISCSSHSGEKKHLMILEKWIKKLGINYDNLECGIHNPLNQNSSDKLLISGNKPTQLHNNCSGKHLGMISGCIANKMKIKNYTKLAHPYQKLIKSILEEFMEFKIKKKHIGIDGCSLPQYAFPLDNIASSMINLIYFKENKNKYKNSINKLINSISKYPFIIGGSNRFDSDLINATKGRIFCKGGAEGVLLFADFDNKIGGIIKVVDGNNRAIPSVAIELLTKIKLIKKREQKKLNKWKIERIYNHANKKVGEIKASFVH